MATVVSIITRLNIGGAALHAILLADGLRPEYQTLLVTGRESATEGSMLPLAVEKRVPIVTIPELRREIDPLNDVIAFFKLLRVIRRVRPQIIHTHTAKAGFIGRIAALLCRAPVIIHTFHGHVFRGYFGPTKTSILLMLERCLALFSSRILTVSEQQREELANFRIAPKSGITCVSLGLDLSHLAANPTGRNEMRGKWGVPLDAQAVGIVARLVKIKGHELFFDSAVEVRKQYPNAWFVVVGDGERRTELEHYAQRLRLPVVFTGWESDLQAVHSALDVVCLTSFNEGSSTALIEALAAAKPVVSTAAGGVVDIVRDGDTGILLQGRDPQAFAKAICQLLAASGPAREMGLRGRDSVFPRYDVSKLLENMKLIYQSLLRAEC